MKIKDAVKTGAKYFKVKTDYGISYLKLIDQFTTFNVRSMKTGYALNVRENYQVTPLDKAPTAAQLGKVGTTNKVIKKLNAPIPTADGGAEIPEQIIGRNRGNKFEGPTMKDVVADNLNSINEKADLKPILKKNGFELSSSTLRYAWWLRNKIIKHGAEMSTSDLRKQ